MDQQPEWKEEQQNVPHRRYNLLTQSWILCSPHRAKRPWLGQVEKTAASTNPSYDPKCYLCPGNKRATSTDEHPTVNPQYTSTYVFPNDYSALLPPTPSTVTLSEDVTPDNLLVSKQVSGTCRVVCFSPRHDLTLPQMEDKDIIDVVKTWTNEYKELSQNKDLAYIQIFENKGETMGCSNPHPHCQIWASSFIPQEPHREEISQKEYSLKNPGHCLLCDYLQVEKREKERIVCQNEGFIVVVPYWAFWPFEVLVISTDHVGNLSQFTEKQQILFADILKKITVRYDNLFQCSFPYSMGIHQTPCGSEKRDYWHFHAHFYPPLLRSATVKKFMVGYEMMAEAQRDLTAEQAATRLKDLPETHFSKL